MFGHRSGLFQQLRGSAHVWELTSRLKTFCAEKKLDQKVYQRDSAYRSPWTIVYGPNLW